MRATLSMRCTFCIIGTTVLQIGSCWKDHQAFSQVLKVKDFVCCLSEASCVDIVLVVSSHPQPLCLAGQN